MLPIPGTSKVNHLEENTAAALIELDDSTIKDLGNLRAAYRPLVDSLVAPLIELGTVSFMAGSPGRRKRLTGRHRRRDNSCDLSRDRRAHWPLRSSRTLKRDREISLMRHRRYLVMAECLDSAEVIENGGKGGLWHIRKPKTQPRRSGSMRRSPFSVLLHGTTGFSEDWSGVAGSLT